MNPLKYPAGLLIFFLLFGADISASAFSSNDVNSVFSAYNSAFYSVTGTNGYIKNDQAGGVEYFWSQAEEIECYIDGYEWTSNSTYSGMITNLLNGFLSYNGSNWTGDIYNDDIMWAVIAFARGGQDTGKTNYCNIAKANFDACYARAWDTKLGGGLYWNTTDASKNACVNGPGSIAAYLLYQIYGDTNYLNKATAIYRWERSVLFNTNSGAIYDNIGTNSVISTWSSTYNQGTFLGAANFIGQTNDAALAANYTMMNLTSGGILPEYGIDGNNSGFNAIYLRWLTRFMKSRNLQSVYEPWLQTNAIAAWNLRRTNDNLSWCQWQHPSPIGTNFNSWDCISSFEILQAAAPTQVDPPLTVPTDYIGYWPLDATGGTSAVDVSGNGNNGVVSGATWNANGRFNGCLNFNGVNSYVQITNRLCNDFSIVFWVKTTQAGSIGQWYNGAGLVDGDAPGTANDFGTSTEGGRFSFGVGNPDTTILSGSVINDGAWHQCIATRQQSTGTIHVYVDGSLQASVNGSRNSLNASTRLFFGAIASGGGYFNGSLDDIKLFNRVLSVNEVSALYDSTSLPASPPASLTATPAGNAQVQLNWWKASLTSSYNLKRSLYQGGPYITITNLTATSYTDTNVVDNKTYYYVVSAVNSSGESSNSVEAAVNTSALTVWLKADALVGLANGAGVSTWSDSSGNGYNAIQPVSVNQPVYVANAMNGLPAIRFNSTNSSYLWFYRPVQDDFTIICVFQSTQGYGSGNLYYEGAGLVNGEVSGMVNDFGTCLFANGSVSAGTGSPDVAANSGAGYNDGHPHILTFKRTKSSGLILLYLDGNLVSFTSGGTESLTAPNQLVLGAQQVLNNYFSGDIAEVQIYNAALSDSDRIGDEHALECKYGLASGSAPAAPTNLSGVAGNRQIALNWSLVSGAASYDLWRSTNGGTAYQLVVAGLTTGSYVDNKAITGQTNYYEVMAEDGCGSSGGSSSVAILLPLPVLGMEMNSTKSSLTISWPAWAGDWNLYTATNLTPPVTWLPVSDLVSSNSGAFSLTVPINSTAGFFRLAAP